MNPRDELDPARRGVLRSLLVDHARTDAKLSPARSRRRRTIATAAGFGVVAAIGAGAVVITLAGFPLFGTAPVATEPPVISSTPTPLPTPTTAPTPTSTPAPPPPPVAPVTYTCDTLIDSAYLADLASSSRVPDPDWPNATEKYGTFHQHFAEYGGLSCRWGVPNSDAVTILSYAPLTPEQATIMQDELTASNYTNEPRADGTVYISPEIPGTFVLFTDDAVFETNEIEHFSDLVPYRLTGNPSSDSIEGFDAKTLWDLCVARGQEEFPGAVALRDYSARRIHLTPDGLPEVYVPFDTPDAPMPTPVVWICQFGGDPDAPTLDFFNAKDI